MENNNKVYLSFGRHGRYGRDTAIERLSMLEAYLSGKYLLNNYPTCDTLYHSPIARAVQTAEFRALGMNCEHLIETQKLSENTPTFEIRKFINTLLAQSSNERHYHFVTHLPVIEKLGLGELGCGETIVLEADNWEEMLAENFEQKLLPVSDFDKCAGLLQKIGYTAQEFSIVASEEIFRKLRYLNLY